MAEGILALMIPFGAFVMVIFIVYFGTKAKQVQLAQRAQVQEKLIERFGTAKDLIEFLESPTGKQFLGDMKEAPRHRAHDRILNGIRNAIILSFLGVGFLALGIPWDWPGFEIPGAILLALGVGFAVAAFVSNKLSKSWGLIDEPREMP